MSEIFPFRMIEKSEIVRAICPINAIQTNRYNTTTFSDGRTLDELFEKMRFYAEFASFLDSGRIPVSPQR